ncbi:hypothetical protein B484DRAFT_395758 [Ochromonadaceae sp. CCMP2298]|nr:hypothetical protein B484DRAFT_395758 [Ochromonadaceae sp. CCMP2298]
MRLELIDILQLPAPKPRNTYLQPPTFIEQYDPNKIMSNRGAAGSSSTMTGRTKKSKDKPTEEAYDDDFVFRALRERFIDLDMREQNITDGRWALSDYDPCTHPQATAIIPVVCMVQALQSGEDIDAKELVPNSQEYFHLRDPPVAVAPAGGKASSTANYELLLKGRQCATALFLDPHSPFFHGFTRYHWGMISVLYSQQPLLRADISARKFPAGDEWDSLCSDGTWDLPTHNSKSFGCVVQRGAYPPDKEGLPPLVSDALRKRALVGGGVGASSVGGEVQGQDPYMKQLAMSNQNAEIANMLAAAGFRQKLGVPIS